MENWEFAILRSQKQSRKQLHFIAVIVTLIPFGLIRLSFAAPPLFVISAILCWSLSVYLWISIKKLQDTHKHNPIQILRFCPEKIVWIYHLVYRSSPVGIVLYQRKSIVFGTQDGKKHSVHFTESEDISYAFQQLSNICPRASKGFSMEKEQLFNLHPENLIDYP